MLSQLNISDNKSTTDFAFGNSNVTQRTHKYSYPVNNIHQQGQGSKMPRVQTV